MNLYDQHVLPHLIDFACGMGAVMKTRAQIVPQAEGRVLEIGIGSGLNLSFYDPAKVTYPQLVDYFWRHIDPTVKGRQFCDVGSQYRSGIYWGNEAERKVAEGSRDALIKSGRFKTIHTELAGASRVYLAEDYHQDYYKKNTVRYSYYRLSCGRDARVKELWK